MSTLGIELSDVGVNAVLIDSSGSSQIVSLSGDEEAMPACAYARAGELWFGPEAQEMAFVYPRRTCSEFIDDLSFQSTNLDGHYRKIMYSQLAYRFFQELLSKVEEEAGAVRQCVIAVPGHYLERNERSEERLGLLLGILGDLGVPVAGIVDMAAAALYSEGLWNVPEGERVFHVDLLAHATHISVFHKRGGLERVNFTRLPQHGFSKMLERFTASMSNRFLAETSFDITEDRQIERAFHAQTREMLFNLGKVNEANLEVSTREKSRQMMISKEMATLELEPQVKLVTQMILRAVNDFANSSDEIQIALSSRAAMIQGLKESIVSQGMGEVMELPPESGAFGVANYGKDWEVVDDMGEARVEVGIATAGMLQAPEKPSAVASLRLIREGRSLNPTHIVCDGLAYRLSGDSFLVGIGESDRFDLVADRESSGEPVGLFRLNLSEDRWNIEAMEGAKLGEIGETGLKAGDAVELRLVSTRKRLALVHCIE